MTTIGIPLDAAVGWLGGRLVLSEFDAVRAYSRIGRESVEVDLLDLRPLAPFARKGQRTVLIFILWSSIYSLFWLGPGAASVNAPCARRASGRRSPSWSQPTRRCA